MESPEDPRHGGAEKVLIAANPRSGVRSRRHLIDRLSKLLSGQNYDVDILEDIDLIASEAEKALENQSLRAIVAAGGDGTVRLVVDRTPLGAPVAILPLGTENLLAKQLGMTSDPAVLCQTICQGNTIQLDAGRANNQVFLLMVSCGFDAEVIQRLHKSRRGHIHHFSYLKPIFDSIRSYDYPEIKVRHNIESDENANGSLEESVSARWVFVVNLPRYALGLRIAPEAIGTDGLLDVCTFEKGSFWKGLVYLGGVILGLHHSWNDFTAHRANRIRIVSDREVAFQLDGDPGGVLPLDIEVLPKRLTLLVEEKLAEKYRMKSIQKMI